MKTEIEVKFVDIDLDLVRTNLLSVGAVLETPMRLMRRAIIETPALREKNAFLRVRDEGNKVTLTYKQFNNLSVDGAKEYEVSVSDFNVTVDLLAAAGLTFRSIQESKRETWTLEGTEIVLDHWPWLKPYMEIEGESEQAIRDIAKKLGLSWDNAVFGDVMAAYRIQYPHLSEEDTVGDLALVRFEDPLPVLFQA